MVCRILHETRSATFTDLEVLLAKEGAVLHVLVVDGVAAGGEVTRPRWIAYRWNWMAMHRVDAVAHRYDDVEVVVADSTSHLT